MSPSIPDVIQLRGLRVAGICGALPEEQVRAQPFEIDVDVETDVSKAGASDRLDDTLDYGAMAAAIEALVANGRFVLLEAMATRIADAILADVRAQAVTVTVRKLRPPVPQHLDTSGVRIRRTR